MRAVSDQADAEMERAVSVPRFTRCAISPTWSNPDLVTLA
jgi:hypothetical protein